MNRRSFLTRTSTAALAASLTPALSKLSAATATTPAAAGATYPFAVSPLAYDFAALEPHIDAATMKLHHGKHHAAYVTNLNAALKDHPTLQGQTVEQLLRQRETLPAALQPVVRNHGGGHLNHEFFWQIMRPVGTAGAGGQPGEKLAAAIPAVHRRMGAAVAIFLAAFAVSVLSPPLVWTVSAMTGFLFVLGVIRSSVLDWAGGTISAPPPSR
jgi:Fe-Mn family superoxide dismutase